jgi:hypothetical protein
MLILDCPNIMEETGRAGGRQWPRDLKLYHNYARMSTLIFGTILACMQDACQDPGEKKI